MTTRVSPGVEDALLVIDVQYDFLPGGALAVADGDAVLPLVNRLMRAFGNVAITQDWHPVGHASFATSHNGAKPFDMTKMPYGDQVLWPDHCVQRSPGARLHSGLDVDSAFLLLRKGANPTMDSYSAFAEADGRPTGLAALLSARNIRRVFLCGLATDYCVAYSALDARKAGLQAVVIDDACRAIDAQGSLAAAWAHMNEAGVGRAAMREIVG